MTSFRLISSEGSVSAVGIRKELSRGPIETLAARISEFFSETDDGPRLVVGALPFDRTAKDYLFQPETAETSARQEAVAALPSGVPESNWIVTPEPSAEAYAASVSKALNAIASDDTPAPLRKVVLSRSLNIRAETPLDGGLLFRRLCADDSVTAFSTLLPDEAEGRSTLIGATPELLVSREGASVVSHPLAGSSRRYADPSADRHSAEMLEASGKDRREHDAVVEAVFDALSPYCRDLRTPEGTCLRATATMWHLGTRIAGTLKDPQTPVAELAAALHPTPAVCGLPRDPAAALIRELEGYDRGFYAGAVGWADARGDGKWYVALRCAQLSGRRARLYSGAGIVAGSNPLAEVDETSAKFLALLDALGVDEQGRPLKEQAA